MPSFGLLRPARTCTYKSTEILEREKSTSVCVRMCLWKITNDGVPVGKEHMGFLCTVLKFFCKAGIILKLKIMSWRPGHTFNLSTPEAETGGGRSVGSGPAWCTQ